ncbi:hypothetical protein TeGR_g14313 [Tetraparma gracilis]|uniref:Uncharacterized protein n=1 Tax=Tetraparma gracilis TaxID=2962635 RepID=A0ABQ6NAG5_9STRA|nr:hypothetical protein TeGR_g14313 [Tetraparma gracilis]
MEASKLPERAFQSKTASSSNTFQSKTALPQHLRLQKTVGFDTAPQDHLFQLIGQILEADNLPLSELHKTQKGLLTLRLAEQNQLKSSRGPFEKLWRRATGNELRGELLEAVQNFVRLVVMPDLGTDCVVHQPLPTLRIHLPHTGKNLGGRHRDGDYYRQPTEVNYWVPLTRVGGSNSLWAESEPGREDFRPFEGHWGSCTRFWGNQCEHYTVENETETTRVSFDLRCVPAALYDDDYRSPLSKKDKAHFRLGQGYIRTTKV